MENLFSVAMSI